MKNFFTSLLGALTALIIFIGGCFLLGVMAIAALVAIGQKKAPVLADGSYLVFDLSATIKDAPEEIDRAALLGQLTGERRRTLQLRAATQALRAAAGDERIAGLLLTGPALPIGGGGFAALKELRSAVEAFKAAGKPVVAYLNFVNTRVYYVASAATDLVLDPYGMILMPGLATESLFLAGALEKYGVGVQVTRVGKYKSAVEPFIRREHSPADREQLQKLLDDVWGDLLADISAGRNITPADVQRAADAEGIIRAPAALEHKLVDRIAYRDEIFDELQARTGRQRGRLSTFKQISLPRYADMVDHADAGSGGKIAVVYAEGEIVDGKGQIGEVGGRKFSRELRQLRQDGSVKAIVLRVNSPGGSAAAAEEIQRELRLIARKKPVVVSMGPMAASGGYWISAYAHRIFAQPTTVTGSIGVFGLFLDVQKLSNNHGFTWDYVKTGRNAGLLAFGRPKTDEEIAIFQGMVDWVYDEFVAKVAEGRNLDAARVQEIAQGRIWSGAEAQKIGLVDEIGGMGDAIADAARRAGLGDDYRLVEYPRKRKLMEAISELLQDAAPDKAGGAGILAQVSREVSARIRTLERFNDPRGIYARLPLDITIK